MIREAGGPTAREVSTCSKKRTSGRSARLVRAVFNAEQSVTGRDRRDRWLGGQVVLKPGKAGHAGEDRSRSKASSGRSLGVRDKLRVLEQRINNHPKLDDAERPAAQEYISKVVRQPDDLQRAVRRPAPTASSAPAAARTRTDAHDPRTRRRHVVRRLGRPPRHGHGESAALGDAARAAARALRVRSLPVLPQGARGAVDPSTSTPSLYPCPKGGALPARRRSVAAAKHSSRIFVDPNTGVEMY